MNYTMTHFMDLLWEMTVKELKVRYKNTTLGFLWAFLYPILQAAIIGYIFRYLYKESDVNYTYSLFLNLLIWNFFSRALEFATSSVVRSRTIIKKAKFPYVVIPLSIVCCEAIHFVSSLVLFICFVSITHISFHITLWTLCVGSILLFLFTAGLSFITSALDVKSRDINFLTQAAVMIWFYATPIVYQVSRIPATIRYAWNFNPLTEIIMLFQYSLFGTPIYSSYIISNSLLILFTISVGIFLFQYHKDSFDDYI